MNSDPMIPEEIARRAVEEACSLLETLKTCGCGRPDCLADTPYDYAIEQIRDSQATIIAKAVGLG